MSPRESRQQSRQARRPWYLSDKSDDAALSCGSPISHHELDSTSRELYSLTAKDYLHIIDKHDAQAGKAGQHMHLQLLVTPPYILPSCTLLVSKLISE